MSDMLRVKTTVRRADGSTSVHLSEPMDRVSAEAWAATEQPRMVTVEAVPVDTEAGAS